MSLAEAVISVIAPHNCLVCQSEGALLCENCWSRLGSNKSEQCYKCRRPSKNSKTCHHCLSESRINHLWIRTKYVFTPKDLIQALKFERVRAAHKVISEAMLEALPDLNPKTIVVPVPTATSRRRERGYDQAELLAREIARSLNLPCRTILLRLGQTRQVGTKRWQRMKQLEDSYLVSSDVKGAHILLVDDVLTTGATLEAAATALRRSGARKINALVFARAL